MTGYTRRAAHAEAPAPHGRAIVLQRKCACGQHTMGGRCDECRKQPDVKLQRQSAGAAVEEVPAVVHDTLRSGGQPLDAETRAFMEPRFGHDFTGVRVHTDALAANSAAAVNAAAYTVGEHIVFREGRYSPRTREGAGLLAHELTHVVQQSGSPSATQTNLAVSVPGDVPEREADAVAERVASGSVVPVIGHHTGAALRRKCDKATPKDCATYEAWLDTFDKWAKPTSKGLDQFARFPLLNLSFTNIGSSPDTNITANMPADLQGLITGKLGASGSLPDCADVAFILRHYYLKAKGQSTSFMVGKDKKSATTYTLGQGTTDKQVRACMIGAGTETFQETRSGFSVVNFYRKKSKNITNLKELIAAGLKPGDMFVWKKLPTAGSGFQGHAQTVQEVVPPKYDPKDPTRMTVEGLLTVVQGNMEQGKGKGQLQQRVYTFTNLTGVPDGDADIKDTSEESFFGAGPWK